MAYNFPDSPTVGQGYSGWVWDGEKWLAIAGAPNQSGVISIQVFTVNGTYVPSPNMTTCVVECWGGGGGGGGAGGGTATNSLVAAGGGGGSYSRSALPAAMVGTSQAVVIGAAGTAGAANAAGGNGGATTFGGTLVTTVGGIGGAAAAFSAASTLGGGNGIGHFSAVGACSVAAGGDTTGSMTLAVGGNGAPSAVGGGGSPGRSNAAAIAGGPAVGCASGGGGASTNKTTATAVGGTGAPGLCVITEYGMIALSSSNAQGMVRFDLPQSLTANQTAQARANIAVTKRNFLINGAFQINQGGYVSAAVLAAAAYGHDQWKAGASGGDYSFTQSTGSTTITIAAGKSLIQPIGDVRRHGGGSYVLAWTGTAQARAGVNTLTPAGSYAASPLLITGQTDGTVMSVEFNTGTLSGVSLTEGNVAPPFQLPDYATELAACQRYVRLLGDASTSENYANGQCTGTTTATFVVQLNPVMRIAPALTHSGSLAVYNASSGLISATAIVLGGSSTPRSAVLNVTVASGLVAGNATTLVSNGAVKTLLSARL